MLEGGPAAKQGVLDPGDHITAIAEENARNWTETGGLSMEKVVQKLRGKAGDPVWLRVVRGEKGGRRQTEIVIRRELLKIPGAVAAEPDALDDLAPAKKKFAQALKPPQQEIRVLRLELAQASTAKKAIDGLLRGSRRGRVVADPETNSLIYFGDAATLELVRSMLEWLDQPASSNADDSAKDARP